MDDRPFDPDAEIAALEGLADAYAESESVTETGANLFAARAAAETVRGPRVLVLGAAVGAWAAPLLERFDRFDIVDAVERFVRQAEADNPGAVTGHVALFEQFEPAEPYDSVVMGHVLEHVDDPVGLLRRAGGWLKPEGRVVVLVPNAGSLHRRVGVRMGMLARADELTPADDSLGHRRVYSSATLRAHVQDAGYRVVHLGGLFLKPLSNSQMDAWPPELRQAFYELGAELPEASCVIHLGAEPNP